MLQPHQPERDIAHGSADSGPGLTLMKRGSWSTFLPTASRTPHRLPAAPPPDYAGLCRTLTVTVFRDGEVSAGNDEIR
jgi:hypothetical protein